MRISIIALLSLVAVSLACFTSLVAAADAPAGEPAAASAAEEAWNPVEGAIVHVELGSLSLQESMDFYGPLFGWQFMPHGAEYTLFMTPDGQGVGGGFSTDMQPGAGGATLYIYCADIDAKLTEIEAAGGKTFMPRTAIPGFGWFALFSDPHGNMVGLFSAENTPAADGAGGM